MDNTYYHQSPLGSSLSSTGRLRLSYCHGPFLLDIMYEYYVSMGLWIVQKKLKVKIVLL